MRIGWAAIALVTFTGSQVATARQDRCSDFMGRSITPETFDQVQATLKSVAPKGEFETTAQYQTRTAAAVPSGQRIISREIEEPKFLEYDADAGLLRIRSWVFSNRSMNYWSAFYESHPPGLEADTDNNIAVTVSSSDSPGGTYEATNSYGAKVTVQRINRTTDAIFERKRRTYSEKLFAAATGDSVASYVGQFKMKPAEAQAIKPQLKIAVVVSPRAPFMVQGEHRPGKTTIQNPFEINEKFRIMIADIQCGLLMDGSNRVIGAYATN